MRPSDNLNNFGGGHDPSADRDAERNASECFWYEEAEADVLGAIKDRDDEFLTRMMGEHPDDSGLYLTPPDPQQLIWTIEARFEEIYDYRTGR